MNWELSKCKGIWLHRFTIQSQYSQGIVEQCQICGIRVFFPIQNGATENNLYLSYHLRQLLVPQHPLFAHEYGNNL